MHTSYILAGVAALAGTAEEWMLDVEHFQFGINDLYSGLVPLRAWAILRKAQGSENLSGMTIWRAKDCLIFALDNNQDLRTNSCWLFQPN
jgi:hypothetical protein